MALQPNLKSMSVDRLMILRAQVDAVLTSKVAEERRSVQEQLNKLDRLAEGGSRIKRTFGGRRGAVPPKYANPDNPSETWAGRGLRPRWLAAAMKAGKKLEHFAIGAAQKKLPAKRKKKA